MKKLILLVVAAFAFSCNEQPKQVDEQAPEYDSFGGKITAEGAVKTSEAAKMLEGKDSVRLKLRGTIAEVCQKKGCWMEISTEGGEPLHVSFKDYEFFVPKDAAGKEVIMEGIAFRDTTPVEDLKHLAQDAGKTEEEITQITEPKIAVAFEASGVLIRK